MVPGKRILRPLSLLHSKILFAEAGSDGSGGWLGQSAKNPKINQMHESSFASLPAGKRKPLAPWEKYAHALLQANEAIFVNQRFRPN